MLIEYKSFKYKELGSNKWLVSLPSGVKTKVEADSENALKLKIEELLSK